METRSTRTIRWLWRSTTGASLMAAALACGDDITGVTGDCTGEGPASRQVRVHIDNDANAEGIKVTLSAGGQTCVIDPLIVDDLTQGNELDQVVMDLDVGVAVQIRAELSGIASVLSCTVGQNAFEGVTSANNRGQAFASVALSPLRVFCGAGFGP